MDFNKQLQEVYEARILSLIPDSQFETAVKQVGKKPIFYNGIYFPAKFADFVPSPEGLSLEVYTDVINEVHYIPSRPFNWWKLCGIVTVSVVLAKQLCIYFS